MSSYHHRIKHLGFELPIIQAPMAGGATTPELIAAVSNAGGLGSMGAGYMTAEQISQDIKKIRSLTDRPFAVNLFIPQQYEASQESVDKINQLMQPYFECLDIKPTPSQASYGANFAEQMAVVLKERVPILSFTFGLLDQHWLEQLRAQNTKVIGTATTLAEALALQELGVDAVVAQGYEAGGHRGTFLGEVNNALIGTIALVPQLVDQLNIPVIASGGIMDGRGIAAALVLGASAVQMGTAFLSTYESGINPSYRQQLLKVVTGQVDSTALTRAFSGKSARGINNQFMQEMKSHETAILDYPVQNTLTKSLRKQAAAANKPEFMSLWAGQGVYLSQAQAAQQLISTCMATLNELLPSKE